MPFRVTPRSVATYLGVQSVAELGNAACDLVKVHRLASAVAFEHIHRHAGKQRKEQNNRIIPK
jgi:hypothetical protein